MAQVNFRIDDETKRKAEALFASMGLSMSGAIAVFINQSLLEQAIPFRVCTRNAIYHEKLEQAFRDYENGKKNYHFHDLIELDDDKTGKPNAKPRRAAHRSRRAST